MKKLHVFAVALLLALAAVFGLLAATRTAGIATIAARPQADRAAITARQHRLDRVQASLRKALADRPPALPALRRPANSSAVATRVVYRRPAPVVVIKHRAGGEHESFDDERGDERDD